MGSVSSLAIRNVRRASGLSLRALARAAGTSASALVRYQQGEMDPTVGTLERILDAAIPRRRRWPSLSSLAFALNEELTAGALDEAWKLVGEVLDDQEGADATETSLFVNRRPPQTGNPQADALVAALAEYLCIQQKIAVPRWLAQPVVCEPFWFVSGMERLRLEELLESPPSFACRGIFVTRRDLERA